MSTDNKRSPGPLPHGFPPLPPGSNDPLDVPSTPTRALPVASPDSDVPDMDEENSNPGVPVPKPQGPDPRELAKRLAEEARMKAAIKSEPPPAAEAAPPKKGSLMDRAPRRSDPVPVKVTPPAPPPEPVRAPEPARAPRPVAAAPAPSAPEKKKSLADRAGKRMSVEEALKAAANEPPPAPKPEPRQEARQEARQSQRAPTPTSAPTPVSPPPATAPPVRPSIPADVAVLRVFQGGDVKRAVVVNNPVVFKALWTAHRARALATGDVALMVAAACLLDAVDRVPAGCLSGVHVQYRGEDITAWVDTARGAVLSATPQPELYLAGL